MGGAKKRSISQAEKQQQLQEKKLEKSKTSKTIKTKVTESKTNKTMIPNITDELLNTIRKIGALTPFSVASILGLKISTAKNLLYNLEEKGLIFKIASNDRIKIFSFK